MVTRTFDGEPRRPDGLRVVGHRGAAGLAPENTLASFAKAVALGVDGVELDVHLTLDGHLAVIHDERVDRTTDGSGAVAAMKLDALRRLDAGGGTRIPTLAEVLDAVPAAVAVHVELKGTGTAAPLARCIGGLDRPVLVSSFDHAELARFHALCPRIRCAPLFAHWRPGALATARALDAWSVNLSDRIATMGNVAALRQADYACLVYTVNEPGRARELRGLGVAGVFTDHPDRLLGDAGDAQELTSRRTGRTVRPPGACRHSTDA